MSASAHAASPPLAPSPSGGLFISFEGIDGAGKTTHIDALAQALQATGRSVLRTREPGGTPLAEKIRALALHDAGMDGLTEALLMFAARRDHLARVIAPALAAGRTVLCDRFTDATFAYQGGGRGFDWQALQNLEHLVQAGWAESAFTGHAPAHAGHLLQPALTLWFDLPPAVAAQRLAGTRLPDKFEAQPAAFFHAVRNAYARRMAEAPARFARIRADQPREAVWVEVQAAMQARGWL